MQAADPFAAGSVLVTGAQGFLGSWLAERLLDAGARVIALRRDVDPEARFRTDGIEERCTVALAELTDHESIVRVLNEHEVATVFHLAAQTIVGIANRSPLATWEANVRGTYVLLEACRTLGTVRRVVVASSDKAYGEHDQLPYREDLPLEPRFPYDVSKACADLIARCYATTYELPVAVTRSANMYGGGDLNPSRLVPEAVAAALAGRSPVIRSDGSPQRDFLYVEDAAAAYLAIADALPGAGGEAFNAGGDEPHSVLEVVALLCRVAGTDVEPDVQGAGTPHAEIDRQYVDSTKLRELTGWRPEVGLEEGLRRTVEWYRAHPEALSP